MSYILDALKKSEEERHQGQVPNLGSNSALIHNPKTKSSLLPWAIVALLVLNVSFLIFWILKEPSEPHAPIENSIPEGQNDGLTEGSNEPLAVESSPKGAMHKIAEQVAVESPIKDKQTDYKDEVVLEQVISEPVGSDLYKSEPVSAHQVLAVKRTTEPEIIVPEGRYQDKVSEETASVALEEAPLLITPKGKSRPYTGPAYTPVAAEQANTAQGGGTDVSKDSSSQSDQLSIERLTSISRLSDKPHSFQIQIPDMAFNSHIYTDTPSARRVMINNIYLREGQTFSGMRVEQITEEGIVLSLKNEPFKMGVLRDWYSPR